MGLTGVIALDGPSGTGKSTAAREVARRLGVRYFNTGAMYRAVGWAVVDAGIDPFDAPAVVAIAEQLDLYVTTNPDEQHVMVNGRRVDHEITTEKAGAAASAVGTIPALRAFLVAEQQKIIADGAIVVEGRDIGTVVAPDAGLKVYLTASPEVRATRRSNQHGGDSAEEIAAAAEAIRLRDEQDTTRADSPLRPASDAITLDTSELSPTAVADAIVDLAVARGLVTE